MHNTRKHGSKNTGHLNDAPVGAEPVNISEESLYTILSEAVDRTFFSLGEAMRQTLYFELEKSFGIKKHEIPNKIDIFVAALETIFGPSTAYVESLFISNIQAKVRTGYKWNFSESIDPKIKFKEFVQNVKEDLENK
jgi:hypothetical protein